MPTVPCEYFSLSSRLEGPASHSICLSRLLERPSIYSYFAKVTSSTSPPGCSSSPRALHGSCSTRTPPTTAQYADASDPASSVTFQPNVSSAPALLDC